MRTKFLLAIFEDTIFLLVKFEDDIFLLVTFVKVLISTKYGRFSECLHFIGGYVLFKKFLKKKHTLEIIIILHCVYPFRDR